MPTTPGDLLQLAEDQLQQAQGECSFRSVINRAYYAIFHRLHAAVCFVNGNPPRDGNIMLEHGEVARRLRLWRHDAVHQRLKMSLGADAAAAYDNFWRSMNQHKLADYHLANAIREGDANVSLIRARKIFAFVERVVGEAKKIGLT